jgi:CMP-N,N'-diacetyllegionaminic acid synthase
LEIEIEVRGDKMNIIALITGRGNNTLNNKNILPVNGEPLLSYGAIEAKKLEDISKYYISSDDDNILDVGYSLGYEKIKRPAELGTPTARHGDVVKHAVQVMDECDILVVLMANCATIKSSQIKDCIDLLKEDESISTVAPVVKDQDHHPYRTKRIEDGFLEPFVPIPDESNSPNRQQLKPASYFLCHSFYVHRVSKCFTEDGQPPYFHMGNKVKPYIVDYSLDVHSMEDIYLTEVWINKEKK